MEVQVNRVTFCSPLLESACRLINAQFVSNSVELINNAVKHGKAPLYSCKQAASSNFSSRGHDSAKSFSVPKPDHVSSVGACIKLPTETNNAFVYNTFTWQLREYNV